MRFAVSVVLALLLLSLESVIVHQLGFAVTRVDVTVALLAFLALRASRMEGAFAAFCVGYLLDLMSGRPTGLYVFLAVLIFLLGRFGKALLDVRSAASFAVFSAGLGAAHALLAVFFTWMTSRGDGGAGFSIGAFFVQVLLTALAAVVLWPLLRRIDGAKERSDSSRLGLLR